MQLSRDLIQRMIGTTPATSVTGGGTAIDPYVLPVAADGTLGGVQVGYTTSAANRNYAVQLDNEKMFVNVPWTDHYAWGDITDKPDTATRWPSWAEVTSKPSSFTPSAHTHAWGDITSGVPATATRWPSWSEVTSKPTSKTAWGQTYLNASSEFQSISGDLSAGSGGGTISQFFAIELNNSGALSGYGGYIDFHFNGSSSDYTSRIIEDASGKLNLNQAVFVNYNGYVGIGDQTPAYKLEVAGNCRISSKLLVATTDSTYALNVGGKIYCTGGFAFLSDIRKKNVVGFCNGFSVRDIANAPLIQYTLKGDLDDGHRHIGSVAQYWQKVLPDTVNEADDTLSMDQESILMASVITLARKVMSLENQIIQLKVKGYGKQ